MPLYHVFVTYRDVEDMEYTLIQPNLPSNDTVLARIIAPLQANMPLTIADIRIAPATITLLRIYRSERPFEALRLPFDQTPVERPSDYVLYYFDQGLVPGVESCTDEFLAPIVHIQPLETTVPRPVLVRVDTEEQRLYYFLTCTFAMGGNLVLTLLSRWAQISITQSQTQIASLWILITSALVFTALYLPEQLLIRRRKSSRLLAVVNALFLLPILLFNLELYFSSPPFNAYLVVLAYTVPYAVMIGQIAVITYTLFYHVAHLTRREQELVSTIVWMGFIPLLIIAAAALVLGLFVAYFLPSSPQYKITLPAMYGYLFTGVILWILTLRVKQRELDSRSNMR